MKILLNRTQALTLTLLLGLMTSFPAFANVGKVLYAIGAVTVEKPAVQTLRRGDTLEEGDIIVTGPKAYVQIRMADGTKFAIRPDTRFVIEAFEAPATATEPAIGAGTTIKASFNLQQGGFRSLSGSLAKRAPDTYQISTPSAVIRVRGTLHSAASDSTGTYFGTSQGQTEISNAGGTMTLGSNQFGFAQTFNTPPQRLTAPPAALADEGLANLEGDEEGDDGDSGDGDGDGESGDGDGDSGDGDSSDGDSGDGDSGDGDSGDGSDSGGDSDSGSDGGDSGGDSDGGSSGGDADGGSGSGDSGSAGSGGDSGGSSSSGASSGGTGDSGSATGGDTGGLATTRTSSFGTGTTSVSGGAPTGSSTGTTLATNSAPPANDGPIQEITAEGSEGGGEVDLTGGEEDLVATVEVTERGMGFAVSGRAVGINTNDLTATFDSANGLTGFDEITEETTTAYEIGTATNQNVGFDPVSNIRWGRWAAGVATQTVGGTASELDLNSESLHWVIVAADEEVPTQAISGSAAYTLVGNTDPTDNAGNVGVLGTATFSADFTNATVQSDLQLGINNQNWSATGSGTINANLFNGLYGTVSVDGAAGGSGSFGGAFGGYSGTNVPTGAGLTYQLTNGTVVVSGAAVFNTSSSND